MKLTDRKLLLSYTIKTNKQKKKNPEAKEAVPFTMATRRVKFLGINLPRLGRDWCTEKNKAWMKLR